MTAVQNSVDDVNSIIDDLNLLLRIRVPMLVETRTSYSARGVIIYLIGTPIHAPLKKTSLGVVLSLLGVILGLILIIFHGPPLILLTSTLMRWPKSVARQLLNYGIVFKQILTAVPICVKSRAILPKEQQMTLHVRRIMTVIVHFAAMEIARQDCPMDLAAAVPVVVI